MTLLNAGLPQAAVAPPQTPVGFLQPFPDMGSILSMPDGSEWLRTGLTIPFDPRYAQAAKVPHLQVWGVANPAALPVAVGSGSTRMEVATDNKGTIVVAYGSTSQLLRSVNGGQSFTAVPLSLGGLFISGVIWAGNRFLAWSNNTLSFCVAHSVDGVSWTLGSQLTGQSLSAPDVVFADANIATNVVCFCAGDWPFMYRCAAGSTVTQTGASGSAGSYSRVGASPAGVWVRTGCAGSTNYRVSTDDGLTWGSDISPPAGMNNNLNCAVTYMPASGLWLIQDFGNLRYWISATPAAPASWATRQLPQGPGLLPQIFGSDPTSFRWSNHDGTVRLSAPQSYTGQNRLYETTDGLLWRTRQLAGAPPNGAGGRWSAIPDGAGGVAMIPIGGGAAGSQSVLKTGSFGSWPSSLGTANEARSEPINSGTPAIFYVRIR